MRVLIINGPNLNLLGTREPEIYGSAGLADLEEKIRIWSHPLGIDPTFVQSNHEGELIDTIHSGASHDAVVINPGAFTHTSRAIADAISATGIPTVEVHISNVKAREPWRAESYLSGVCIRTIFGRGLSGYGDALRYLANRAAVPFETFRYGPHEDNVGDLRAPDDARGLVVLVHGGFLLQEWERDTTESLAIDLWSRNYATWNIEYRRIGSGGGWPGSAHDVKMALDFVPQLGSVGSMSYAVVGHSAGGYLAIWAGVRGPVRHAAATVGLSAITDLTSAIDLDGVGADVAAQIIDSGAPPALEEVPDGTTLIHASEDHVVPPTHSTRLEGITSVEVVDGLGHFDLLDPAKDHMRLLVELLEEAFE